jgi:hypothetical protein
MLDTHNSRLKSAGKRRRSLLEKVLLSHLSPARGEILRPPENSVPQTIVCRNKEIGDKLFRKHRKKSFVPVQIFFINK